MLRLVASRSVWSEGEPVDLQASLIFEAGESHIQVAGSGSGLISFSLQELNGRRKVEGAATSDCRFYTMARGVPVTARYTKSGGFSDGDPDAAWVRAFLQDPLLRLPKGRWRVTAYSDFFEQTCGAGHAHRQISVSLDFDVT